MHIKPIIVAYSLFLTLSMAGFSQTLSAGAASGAVTVNQATPKWKSIPEDQNSWRREPFKYPETTKHNTSQQDRQNPTTGEMSDLDLQGIMKSNKNYYALINGRTIKTGDRIDGRVVTGISRHRVTLRRENEKQTFDIYQGKIDRGTR